MPRYAKKGKAFEKKSKKIAEFQNFFRFSENICMKRIKKLIFAVLTGAALMTLYSCRTVPVEIPEEKPELSRRLLDKGQLNAKQLADFFLENNPAEDRAHITRFAQYYIDEAGSEGINSDVAFAQMCLETGYLRFGGLVQPEFHNYCGLGAMDAEHPGEIFETEELGVRAHIQHLQAYATTEDVKLNKELVDPRYNWVHKTKYVEDIFGLAGNWATDPNYGQKIDSILERMSN